MPDLEVFGLNRLNVFVVIALCLVVQGCSQSSTGGENFSVNFGQTKVYWKDFLEVSEMHRVGFLAEERGLYKKMTAHSIITYFARLKGLSNAEAKSRASELLEATGLGDFAKTRVSKLSKGMAQKIQFIATVLHEPQLLILDEPFSGFDPVNANLIKDEIFELREKGATVIFSTHRMESVEELCEYIALIHKSEKILDGKLSDIKKAYKNNIFNVGVQMEKDAEAFMRSLGQKFNILSSEIDALENQIHFKVQLPSSHTGDILAELSKVSNINRFEETIPSANDIFIQTVNNKDNGK